MIRLRECVVSRLLSSPSTSAIFPLRRLLSAAAAPISQNPSSFAVEDYLVHTCGLTRTQALKASPKLSYLKSPANPDAVLAFLAFRSMVACAERLGVPRGSGMFRFALQAVAFLSEEKITAKVEYLKNTFRWSDAEVSIAVYRAPIVLRNSKESLKRRSEFLFSEVGLEPVYIAHQPAILSYSMEGRLRPRYYVIKFLKQNGLVERDSSFCTAVKMTEKVFVEKLISPHKEAAPHLAGDYATACKGEVPTNFRFA